MSEQVSRRGFMQGMRFPAISRARLLALRPRRWLAIAFLILGSVCLLSIGSFFYRLRPVGTGGVCEIEIEEGTSAYQVAQHLTKARLIHDANAFLSWAQITGNARKLRAGWYRIDPHSNAGAILAQLVDGETIQERWIVPEGYTTQQIAANWERDGWGSQEEFLTALEQESERRGKPLEGYLFPETYTFERGTSAQRCIGQMFDLFDKRWDQLVAAGHQGTLSKHETVILASIVEKEARVDAERPLIAGVFHNRLRLGWRLQADPTVAYILGYPQQRLTSKDLKIDSPYNTYRSLGLPPGPICNPGDASLKAAWQPMQTEKMYFVAQGDGTHYFSKTLAEHNRKRKEMKASFSSPLQ